MQDASPGQGAPGALRHWDVSEQAKVGGISLSPSGPLVERVFLVSEVLTQVGNRSSDAGGHREGEFGTKGGKLPRKEPQGWAGPFWELRVPSCKCPGGEGTAGARWAGTQLGTATGPHEQGNAACTSLRGIPTGTGRLGEPEERVWGCQSPLFLSRNPAEVGQSLPLAGSKPCPVRCWLGTALAGPWCWGTSRDNRIPLGEPAWSSPARLLPCRSRIVLTQQQGESCSGQGLAGSAVLLPRPRVSWHRLFVARFTAWPRDSRDSPEPLPARDPQPSPEIWAAASFTPSCCWLKSLISLAGG